MLKSDAGAQQEAPTVSVLMITYNHERFIAQAIESVLVQRTSFRVELVIGEDCSTDSTRAIVEHYASAHPATVRPLLHERNLGMAATARAHAKAHQWKAMDGALKQLSALPDAALFLKELNTIRFTGQEAAKVAKDRATEGRVQRLCDESLALIKRYLDADKIKVIKEELDELRKSELESEKALQATPAS